MLSQRKVNPSDRLVLVAVAGPAELAFGFEWSLARGALATTADGGSLAVAATTALVSSAPVAAGAVEETYLVLPANSLTAGGEYEFRLTAAYALGDSIDDAEELAGMSGYSTLTVIANGPPSSGSLSLTPSAGIALETPFDFECSGWVDDPEDLPLRFWFFYAIGGDNDVSDEEALAASGHTEYALVADTPSTHFNGAILPPGNGAGINSGDLANSTSVITGIGYIADQVW